MPFNYRKNSCNLTTEYYSNISCLNGPGISQTNRINLKTNDQIKYIGLVSPDHEQAGDLSVNVCGQNLRLARMSKFESIPYSAGYNYISSLVYGFLGIGNCNNVCVLTPICKTDNFCDFSMGENHSLALTTTGQIYGVGYNGVGQLGLNTTTGNYTQFTLSCNLGLTFSKIGAGSSISAALTNNGKLYVWGDGGNIGLGAGNVICSPTLKCSSLTFCKISVGRYHILALTDNGKLYAAGSNLCGQIGVGSTGGCYDFTLICSSMNFREISATAGRSSFAIRDNNNLYAWGHNCYGGLGLGNLTFLYTTPQLVNTPEVFNTISGGTDFSLGLTSSGKIYITGRNNSGQLGLNYLTTCILCNYTLINCNLIFCQAIANSNSTVALTNNKKLYGWGFNACGGLGLGNTTNYCTPQLICGDIDFYSIHKSNSGNGLLVLRQNWLKDSSPQGLSYPANVITLISTTVSYSPTLTSSGEGVLTYSISPNLPSGLNFNSSTGVISGTTPSTANDTTYTITVTNSSGSTTTSFRIRIVYVNTTMTIGSNIDGEGFGTIGYENGFYGSLTSNTFRNGIIIALVESVDSYGNNYGGISFTINISLSNTDNASFKQIVWNGVTYLRSNFDYYTTSANETQWSYTAATAPFDPVTFLDNGTPATVSLIIE